MRNGGLKKFVSRVIYYKQEGQTGKENELAKKISKLSGVENRFLRSVAKNVFERFNPLNLKEDNP